MLARRRSEQLFTVRWRARGAIGFQGHRNVGTLFCSASPRPPVRPATCRPDPPVVCPGFGLDRFALPKNNIIVEKRSCNGLHEVTLLDNRMIAPTRSGQTRCAANQNLPVESKTRTYHERVESGRPAERPGGVRQDWVPTELFAQETKVPCTSKASKKRRFNVSPEAQTNEILCKAMEEQKPRLTRSLSPVYPRFITGTTSAFSSWLLTSGPTPCLCKPFSCKACPGINSADCSILQKQRVSLYPLMELSGHSSMRRIDKDK